MTLRLARRALGAALSLAAALPAAVRAQTGAAPPSATLYVDVLRTRTDLRQATAELGRATALRDHAMLSPSEYDERYATWERARLAHLSALATAVGARAHLALVRAVKTRRADGALQVELTLRNDTQSPAAAFVDRDTGLASDLASTDLAAWSTVRGASVALKTDPGANGATISRPYERRLPDLPAGRSATMSFDLLEDVGDVVVAFDVAGRTDERRIRLEIASNDRGVAIDAAQSSLEGDLGTQVVYDLRLRRPRPSTAPLRLDARGLPPEVLFEFRARGGLTRLRQLQFADGATDATVQLVLSLPARPSAALPVERAIPFDVLAGNAAGDSGGAATGSARLELVPRGVARLEMRPAALTLDVDPDRATVLPVTIRNAGSGRVDELRVSADPPARWQVTAAPAVVPRLAPGEEARVQLHVQPPPDALVGDYELRVGIDDAGAARRVDVEDKLVRLHLAGRGGILSPLLLAVSAVGVTLALLVRGRRWLNR